MFAFREILSGPPPRIHIADVGAMTVLDDATLEDAPPVYHRLLETGAAAVTGFEPVAEECEKLNRRAAPGQRFLPYAIGDGGVGTFRRCNAAMTSSLYEPDLELMGRFNHLGELCRVVERSPMATHRLDDIPELGAVDYLKLDIQGAELDALAGAPSTLAGTLVVHTEVEFVALYRGQPLFADVDRELRRQGFCFHCLHGVSGRTFKPVVVNNDPRRGLNQALWGDAVYVKDWMGWDRLEAASLLKAALILHEVYGSYDLAQHALEHHDRQTGAALQMRYLERLFGRG